MSFNIAILYGSVRTNRQGIRFAKYLKRKCEERNFNTTLIDPKEYKLPLLDKMYKEYKEGEAPEVIKNLAEILEGADGFIVVSGEYNHSIPPALTNLMDYFQKEYYFKPAAIATYSSGNFAGVRAAMQLRAFLSELGMPTISSLFSVGKVGTIFDNDGNLLEEIYEKRTQRFLNEFEWYVNALKNARINGIPF